MGSTESTLMLYADYVCPFCYLEQQALSQYHRDDQHLLTIDWRPYDIRHEKRDTNGTLNYDASLEYPERVHERIARLKSQRSAEDMLAPDNVPLVDSLPGHIVSAHIKHKAPDRWFAFSDALFEALWCDGRDISDPRVLSEVAEQTELTDIDITETASTPESRIEILDRFSDARTAGIEDVPTLVVDGQTIDDVVSVEDLERVLG